LAVVIRVTPTWEERQMKRLLPDNKKLLARSSASAAAATMGLAVTVYILYEIISSGAASSRPVLVAADLFAAVLFGLLLYTAQRTAAEKSSLETKCRELVEQFTKLQNTHNSLLESLAEEWSAADEFLTSISHELRTSLNAVTGWARILSAEHAEPYLRTRAVQGMERSIARLAEVLDETTVFLALEEGDSLRFENEVACSKLVSAILEDLSEEAVERRIDVSVVNEVDGAIRCDETRVKGAVASILGAVIRLVPPGDAVKIRAATGPEDLCISIASQTKVEASGGMAAGLGALRQALRRNNGSRPFAGIELAISRRVIELHGGNVEVKSCEREDGTEVGLFLPLAL